MKRHTHTRGMQKAKQTYDKMLRFSSGQGGSKSSDNSLHPSNRQIFKKVILPLPEQILKDPARCFTSAILLLRICPMEIKAQYTKVYIQACLLQRTRTHTQMKTKRML